MLEPPEIQDFRLAMESSELPSDAWRALNEQGFAVIPGPLPASQLPRLAAAYDRECERAAPGDVRVGSSTTRVDDFVNRGPIFDALYVYPPVLKACCLILEQPFRLSTIHARTLRPALPAQRLHVDYPRDEEGWTMVGFIFMVDEFREDNGATRFLPGSHHWTSAPTPRLEYDGPVLACGVAGSMIVFNGSVWHGHTANRSDRPRRSIQGAYIRREAPSSVNLSARMLPETLGRISPLAKYILSV